MVKNRRLFTAGKRLRALRELMGLSRPQFAELVGMTAKRLENIENELQRMHDEDFEKVCGTFPEFSDWIAYEGSIEPQSIAWKVADSAQAAAVYLVEATRCCLSSTASTCRPGANATARYARRCWRRNRRRRRSRRPWKSRRNPGASGRGKRPRAAGRLRRIAPETKGSICTWSM